MKPTIEKISNKPDFDWRIHYYHGYGCGPGFDWHYHVEYELVLHRHYKGKKFVGDYIGSFGHNDLSLYGPRLPHTDTPDNSGNKQRNDTYIIWFSQAWICSLIQTLPELSKLQVMLDKSLQGIEFTEALAEQVFLLLENYQQLSPALAVSRVIEVLVRLSESDNIKRLNSYSQLGVEQSDKSLLLVEKISQFIEKNYRSNIKLADLCAQIHVSKSTVSRAFERHFLSSFSLHLAEYRLGKACEYLVNSETSIAAIADLVGFNNLSNFNRQFKAKKQMSPKQFRRLFSQ